MITSPASFAPFSGPPILGHCRVRTLWSSVPTAQNPNTRDTPRLCTYNVQSIYQTTACLFFILEIPFLSLTTPFTLTPSFTWISGATTLHATSHVIENRTQGQRNFHIARLTPPQTFPIYCLTSLSKSMEQPYHIPKNANFMNYYILLPTSS